MPIYPLKKGWIKEIPVKGKHQYTVYTDNNGIKCSYAFWKPYLWKYFFLNIVLCADPMICMLEGVTMVIQGQMDRGFFRLKNLNLVGNIDKGFLMAKVHN